MDEMTKDEILSVEAAPEKTAEPTENDKVTDLTAEQCDSSAVEKSEAADAGSGEAETTDADNSKPAKAKKPLPAKLQKIVDYLNAHEDVRQMVFFLMFSVLCGASQMIVTYALSAGLKLAPSLSGAFSWFVFKFATTAEFIGFLIGSIVGQALTFILNRKKTFNTTDHIAIRAVMYAIMAIIIIIMQTYLGGVVTSACYSAQPAADGFLALVFNLTGQAVAGIAAVIVNFLGNKFFIMRDWGKKKQAAQANADVVASEGEAAAEAQTTVEADIQSTENDTQAEV